MKLEQVPDPTSDRLRATLDAVDRLEFRYRALMAVVIAGCIGLAIWFDRSLQNSTAPSTAALERGVALIVALMVLLAVRLQQSMKKQTQLILRAIAELGRKA